MFFKSKSNISTMKKFQFSNIKSQMSNKTSFILGVGNWKLEIPHGEESGFTLIEVLVSISIIVVVGVIVASIVITTLRGSTKASVLSDVKQNGDYALSEMSRVIRGATSITNPIPPCNPSVTTNSMTVTQLDNSQVTFDCSGTTITEKQNAGQAVSLLD